LVDNIIYVKFPSRGFVRDLLVYAIG